MKLEGFVATVFMVWELIEKFVTVVRRLVTTCFLLEKKLVRGLQSVIDELEFC